MIGIAEIEYFVPSYRPNITDYCEQSGITLEQAKVFERIYKLKQIPVYDEGDAIDFVSTPIIKLLEQRPSLQNDVGLIIYAHTSAILTTFGKSISRQIQQKFNFHRAQSFGFTLNKCVASIKALQLAKQFLLSSKNDFETVLLISGEVCYSSAVRLIPNTSVAGDAIVAVVLTKRNYKYAVIDATVKTYGRYSSGIWMEQSEIAQYDTQYINLIGDLINSCLDHNKIALNNIKKILPHNVNHPSWKKAAQAMNYQFEHIYTENISRIAHTLGADIYINLKDSEAEKHLKSGDLALMVSVGLGASFGYALLKH